MEQQSNGLQRLASYSWVAVVLAVLVCYGSLALAGLLAQMGITLSIHPGVRAAAMVVLVWIAVLGLGINLHRYRNFGPFLLADLGALMVSWVTLVEYEGGDLEVRAGQAVVTTPGEWVRYSTPEAEGAEYVAVCLPAFSPETVHRDP